MKAAQKPIVSPLLQVTRLSYRDSTYYRTIFDEDQPRHKAQLDEGANYGNVQSLLETGEARSPGGSELAGYSEPMLSQLADNGWR